MLTWYDHDLDIFVVCAEKAKTIRKVVARVGGEEVGSSDELLLRDEA